MKKIFLLFFIVISCSDNTNDMIVEADFFIENSASLFIKNKELTSYNYNSRTQFDYENSESDKYRILIQNNRLKFYCFSDSCLLDSKIGLYKSRYLKKGFYDINKDTIRLHFKKDSIIDFDSKFDKDPIKIFQKYKSEIKKLRLLSYKAKPKTDLFYVYLNSEYLLLKSKKIEDFIYKNDIVVKKYKNNWSLIKREQSKEY